MTEKPLVAIWGTGREGLAAASLWLRQDPHATILFIDEAKKEKPPASLTVEDRSLPVITEAAEVARIVSDAPILIKSPGVSLYHPLLQKRRANGKDVTSLLNLWLASHPKAQTIAVTGTKGKSTTASLLGHVLRALGQKTAVLGNIGTPLTEGPEDAAFFVIEVSSYQAATLHEKVSLAVLTSLYPEHLDWHGTLQTYYSDKSHLLDQGRQNFLSAQASVVLAENNLAKPQAQLFGTPEGWHFDGSAVKKGDQSFGVLHSPYLTRAHNKTNVLAVIAMIEALGFDIGQALEAMESFQGLPHRQQEIGEKDGLFYVDDSISTTPHSAIAAMEAFAARPLCLIAGGYDRGVPYDELIAYILAHDPAGVVCLGASGPRLFAGLREKGYRKATRARTMEDAVREAQARAPQGGVILLSPGAPSYDMYKDFTERAAAFVAACGLQSKIR